MQGLYRYLARNTKGKKGQSGFTLIELLVVVTILGVLAAIVTLSLVGLTTSAEAKACEQEYKTVQAGLDSYMAYFNLGTVTGATTNLMTTSPDGTHPLYNKAPSDTAPTFVRNSPTVYTYTWNQYGQITGIGGPAVPTGCVVSG
jgi:prepilin-type N-terminal cleavage/methylation domain-containing protein